MLELAEKAIKIVNIIVFYMFRLCVDMTDFFKCVDIKTNSIIKIFK